MPMAVKGAMKRYIPMSIGATRNRLSTFGVEVGANFLSGGGSNNYTEMTQNNSELVKKEKLNPYNYNNSN
jgi:hypothetical protein